MRETEAIIERVWRISPQLQRLELSVEPALAAVAPGQSLLALEETAGSYLREQWIPVAAGDGQLNIDRPADRHYALGQIVNLLGPIGSGLPWVGGGGKHLLLVAHDTAPTALLMLARQAVGQMAEVVMVLLGESTLYPFESIPPAVEVINGEDDGSWANQEKILNWADQIFAVVNEAFWVDYFGSLFHRVKKTRDKVPANFLYGVFTLPLPCGTGACTACMVRCKTTNKLICTQGPALDLSEVMLS